MTREERIQAVIDFGFTERQARFVVLVVRHAGVCVPRQYASFADIANGGRRCNAFFDRLVRRGYAHEIGCVHNRARLYHLHHKPLHHAIGEATSTYRRRVSPRLAVERLMLLDSVLPMAHLEWLTTASERAAYVARLSTPASVDVRRDQSAGRQLVNAPRLSSTFPIGLEPDGRVVLLYLATEVETERFRRFLQDNVRLLRVTPTWALRIVFPRPLDRVYDAYQTVVHEELESPVHAGVRHELQKYFEQRRQAAHMPAHQRLGRTSNAGPRFLQTPRFAAMYTRWLRQGNAVFEGPSSPTLAEALGDGRGRVESVVLPHSYRHLSPLVDRARSRGGDSPSDARRPPFRSHKASKNEALRERNGARHQATTCADEVGVEGVEKGAGRGEHRSARAQPRSSTPWR